MIEFENEYTKKAADKKDEEKYAEAADTYVLSAFHRLSRYSFCRGDESNRNLAVPDLLNSVMCATETDLDSSFYANLVDVVCSNIADCTDDDVLTGLTHEWIGDAYLICNMEAVEEYKKAKSIYIDSVDDPELF